MMQVSVKEDKKNIARVSEDEVLCPRSLLYTRTMPGHDLEKRAAFDSPL